MNIITVDFETYYDRDYSLSKMTTESYVRDPRFEVIGVSVSVDGDRPDWFSGDDKDVESFLRRYQMVHNAVLCHNTAFDGAILAWRYNIRPKLWLDSMSMARPHHGLTTGCSLSSLSNFYALGAKGTAVANYIGRRRASFSPHELADYGDYCKQDNALTYKLFKRLAPMTPQSELELIDMTIRMFTEPTLEFDKELLQEHLAEVQTKKKKFLDTLGGDKFKDILMSNDKFAAVLEKMGVTPPIKTSKSTGKPTYAFAKTDKEFTALQEHHNPMVQALVSARLGVKSTIEETRTQSFIGIAERGPLPIMLNYWGAHPGRFSGGDKVNLQNLPRGGKLRKAIKAPKGHKIIVSDSAQIEARLLAYVSGQEDLVQAFRERRDVYSEFAGEVYGRTITKADVIERFVGKTCISEGTMVLTDTGLKPVECISTNDKLWDGDNWVCHSGLVENGIKPTLNLSGVWLTPDHLVWSGEEWKRADCLSRDAYTLSLALGFAAENLPLLDTLRVEPKGYTQSLLNATATMKSTQYERTTSGNSSQLDVTYALKKRLVTSGTGFTRKLCQMIVTELDYLTGYLRLFLDATLKVVGYTNRTGEGAYKYVANGERIEPRSLDMYKPCLVGTTPNYRWTGSTMTVTMNRGTYASCLYQRTQATKEKSTPCKTKYESLRTVYDIANVGPKHRFFVWSDSGYMCVSNCVLGLGYMCGPTRFREMLASGVAGPAVMIDELEAKRIVSTYRKKNHKIVSFWNVMGNVLKEVSAGRTGPIVDTVPIHYAPEKIILPNTMYINYPGIRASSDGFEYSSRKQTKHIYSGKAVENTIQALARLVIVEQMLEIGKKYRIVLQVHDEIVCVVRDEEVEEAKVFIQNVMSKPPRLAPDLPIACEIGVGESYGSAKA